MPTAIVNEIAAGGKMDENKLYLPEIVDILKKLDPYKIILFGSHATGAAQTGSDIDIIVVTNDDYMPENYRQKSELYLKVSNVLSEFLRKTPIDLIVYTKPMYYRFNELGSVFSKEIGKKGIVLYETGQQGMA
jgi:predicted nucleotidyltransferase